MPRAVVRPSAPPGAARIFRRGGRPRRRAPERPRRRGRRRDLGSRGLRRRPAAAGGGRPRSRPLPCRPAPLPYSCPTCGRPPPGVDVRTRTAHSAARAGPRAHVLRCNTSPPSRAPPSALGRSLARPPPGAGLRACGRPLPLVRRDPLIFSMFAVGPPSGSRQRPAHSDGRRPSSTRRPRSPATARMCGRRPPPVAYTCSVSLGAPDLGVSARPGEYSQPVRQTVRNSGNLTFAAVDL